mmetsp:Transcript_5932/g.19128  ORF Transcript_5932/g.19128 Transcript_5932/m.19128 type:complete len:247 (-) Transcript_5932:548-1288(-)
MRASRAASAPAAAVPWRACGPASCCAARQAQIAALCCRRHRRTRSWPASAALYCCCCCCCCRRRRRRRQRQRRPRPGAAAAASDRGAAMGGRRPSPEPHGRIVRVTGGVHPHPLLAVARGLRAPAARRHRHRAAGRGSAARGEAAQGRADRGDAHRRAGRCPPPPRAPDGGRRRGVRPHQRLPRRALLGRVGVVPLRRRCQARGCPAAERRLALRRIPAGRRRRRRELARHRGRGRGVRVRARRRV